MKLTPLHLNILLHGHTCPAPFPLASPIAAEYAAELAAQGLLEIVSRSEFRFKCTPRGDAHILQILNLPLPQQVWVDAQGKPIE